MRFAVRFLVSVALLSGFALTCAAQEKSVSFLRLGSNIVQRKANLDPQTPEDRRKALRQLFKDAGCTEIVEQPVSDSDHNIFCSTSGTGTSTILVSAPLDYTAKGDDASVRWGDLAMLPTLAESLGSVLTRHRLVFIGFGGKNKGEAGAKAYLDSLKPEQRAKIDAIVAFDEIGRTLPAYSVPGTGIGIDIRTGRLDSADVMTDRYNPSFLPITRSIPAAAQRWGFPVPRKTGEFGANVTKPFHKENIAAITFTSPSWVVVRYVGDRAMRDYRTRIDPSSYNNTYLFLCAYLLHLDRDIGKALEAPSPQLADALLTARLSAMESIENLRLRELPPSFPLPQAAAPPPPTVSREEVALDSNDNNLPVPVFRATSRLVQVDIVATDRHGAPIRDLKKEDFTILQDGRPQNPRVFELHGAPETIARANSAPAKPAPPHYLDTFSNAPDPSANQSWTIILFDMLNTPSQDQQVARNQLKKLAEQVPSGQPVALFGLTSRLVMLQSFTTDNSVLMASVNKLQLWHSQVLTTEAERQQQVGTAAYLAKTSTDMAIPAQANVSQSMVADFQNDTTNRFLLSTRDMESLRLDQRTIFTLDAFEGISRALAGYPGRKNLIWLSGNFPIRILPDLSTTDKFRYSRDYMDHLTKTVTLLSQSRVAVYPVDIRGMQTRGIDIATSTAQTTAFIGGNSSTTGMSSVDKTGDLLNQQSVTASNERETMAEVAEQTGGRAFINTNDFGDAIRRAMNDGSSYYTLAYAPDTKDDKPVFHRIDVKLNRSDVKLSYRRGYYSEPEIATQKAGLAALQASLQPGMPPSTMVIFTASVKPPDATRKTVLLNYVISPNNVTLGDAPGGAKHIVVDCMAVAFDKEGKEVAHASDTLDGTMPMAQIEKQLRRGLPASQELELKPGVYNVRVGVQDRASQSIGTLTIPVVVQ